MLRVGIVKSINETKPGRYNNLTGHSVRVVWTHNGKDKQYTWVTKESSIQIKPEHSYAKLVKLDPDYVAQFPEDIEHDDLTSQS